jgi:sterol desaturase/sphingolipid hydroxylase (fatty acid hydroxylase superfamily)
MYLSKYGYYSDFVVYPLVILSLTAIGLHAADGAFGAARWLGLFVVSVGLWTLIEYGLHRFAFHHFPFIKGLHNEHHLEERELVGSPIWLSLAAHALFVFVPIYLLEGIVSASAIAAGIMLGYLWYVSVHHILHHWHVSHSGYLYKLKRRHALHHHADEGSNFGVTTGFWDEVFGTATPQNVAPRSPGNAMTGDT